MSSPIVIAALYRFVRLDNYESLRQPLLDFMLDKQLRGTLLLAAEGINGTIAGNAAAIESLLDYLRQDDRLRELDYKLSFDDEMPFYRSRVKLKREIVTMGVEDIDPAQGGTYVDARHWNALIDDPDVTLIDTNTLKFGEGGGNTRIPRCRSGYVDADAYLDLICKFVPGTAESVLTGSLVD